jgi:hypothetical protein
MFSTAIFVLSRLLLARAAPSIAAATRIVRSLFGRLLRWRALLSTVVTAAMEGLQKAEQYRVLAHRSDAELAERGLRRDELLRFIMFVKH